MYVIQQIEVSRTTSSDCYKYELVCIVMYAFNSYVIRISLAKVSSQ